MRLSIRQIKRPFLASFLACASLWACAPNVTPEDKIAANKTAELLNVLRTDPNANMCKPGTLALRDFNQNPSKPASSADLSQGPNTEILDHSHIPVAVPDGVPLPHMTISLTPDVMSGYNLSIQTENYAFMPPPHIGQTMESLMTPVIDPETGFVQGHAHLYINGEKIQRVYGENIHLPAGLFRNGMNQLNVTINNHAHMFWTYDDKEIISSLFINTNTPQLVLHRFDRFPVKAPHHNNPPQSLSK